MSTLAPSSEQVRRSLWSWPPDGTNRKGGGPQVNKFEQVLATRCHYQREGRAGVGSLYGVVQCIMGNGHMDPLWTDRLTDTHDWKHNLPETSLAGGKDTSFANRWWYRIFTAVGRTRFNHSFIFTALKWSLEQGNILLTCVILFMVGGGGSASRGLGVGYRSPPFGIRKASVTHPTEMLSCVVLVVVSVIITHQYPWHCGSFLYHWRCNTDQHQSKENETLHSDCMGLHSICTC